MTRRFNAAWILTCSSLVLGPELSMRAAAAQATGNAPELQTVVIEATAIPGTAVDADKIPGNVQSVTAADLARQQGTAFDTSGFARSRDKATAIAAIRRQPRTAA